MFAAIVVLGISILAVFWQSNAAYATTFTTKAKCAGIGITVSATAPSSVQTGSSFAVTNVSSTSTAPNGITVNKITSTVSASNATPTSTSGSWSGAGTGTFVAHFPDFSLTATGAGNSQIKLTLNSIDLYVNGSTTPITCSVANGQLTASASGESLTVFTIAISAPASSATSSSKSGSNAAANTSVAATTAPTSPSSGTPVTPSTTSTNPNGDANTDSNTTRKVSVTAKDSDGKPLINAKVVMDSLPAAYTNSRGVATFSNVRAGDHSVAVISQDQRVIRNFTVDNKSTRAVALTVQLPASSTSGLKVASMLVACILVGGLLGFMYLHIKRHHAVQGISPSEAPLPTNPSNTTPNPVIYAPNVSTHPIDSPAVVQPNSQPIVPNSPITPPQPAVAAPQVTQVQTPSPSTIISPSQQSATVIRPQPVPNPTQR